MRWFYGPNFIIAVIYAAIVGAAIIAGQFAPVFLILAIGAVFHAGLAWTDAQSMRDER